MIVFKKLSKTEESKIGKSIKDNCKTRKMTKDDYEKYGYPTIKKDQLSKKNNCIASDVLDIRKN